MLIAVLACCSVQRIKFKKQSCRGTVHRGEGTAKINEASTERERCYDMCVGGGKEPAPKATFQV